MSLVTPLTQSVLLLLTFSSFGRAQNVESTCCNLQQKNSKNLTLLELPIQKLVNELSPLYQAIVSGPAASEEASACYTFLPMSDTRFLQFIASTSYSGKITVETSIISDNNPTGGVYRVEGSYGDLGNETFVRDSYYFDVACSGCKPIYIQYRNVLFDSCEYINYEYDMVYGLSSSVSSAPSCLDKVEEIVKASGLQVAGFRRATGTPSCVAYFNNVAVVNAERIDPDHAISYPLSSDSCGC